MADKHTPTPWYAWLPKGVSAGCRTIRTVEGRTHGGYSGTEVACTVGRMDDDVDKANAALIVRAVNHHEELVEALKELNASVPIPPPGLKANFTKEANRVIDAKDAATAVLKKVGQGHA